jgi:hypothetical protein
MMKEFKPSCPEPVQVHFDAFCASLHDELNWGGHVLRAWAEHVTGAEIHELPDQRVTRGELEQLLKRLNVEHKMLAVLAWGGMNRNHGCALWACRKYQFEAGTLLQRLGELPFLERAAAYACLKELRAAGACVGMGPAYFTKLIRFLGAGDGYIMDQWTARSINLLFGPIIRLERVVGSWRVSDLNTAETYARYCVLIECLSARLAQMGITRTPDDVERYLFSEGRKRGRWRNHVRKYEPGPTSCAAE